MINDIETLTVEELEKIVDSPVVDCPTCGSMPPALRRFLAINELDRRIDMTEAAVGRGELIMEMEEAQ